MAVAAADRFHRADILFALSMALAADRFSADGWTACSRLLRPDGETGADRNLDWRRLPVVEIHRNALPIEGQGYFESRRFRRRFDRDGFGGCALRPGVDRQRGVVPLSGARGGDRRLPRLRSFRAIPVRPMLFGDQ